MAKDRKIGKQNKDKEKEGVSNPVLFNNSIYKPLPKFSGCTKC